MEHVERRKIYIEDAIQFYTVMIVLFMKTNYCLLPHKVDISNSLHAETMSHNSHENHHCNIVGTYLFA